MDLTAVATYRRAATRADLALAPGEALLAGGTWLYSEANRDVTGLVDLTALGWEPLAVTEDGLEIAATCTIAQLVALPPVAGWTAQPLFEAAADALLASFKVWTMATVGGNVARAYAAGAISAALVTLDASATVWTPDGGARVADVPSLLAGNGVSALAPGEVIRSFHVPAHALRARAGLRKIALAEHGRSGAVVSARIDLDGATTVVVTAATTTPVVLRYPTPPAPDAVAGDVEAADGWYTDALGEATWRRHVSAVLASDLMAQLG